MRVVASVPVMSKAWCRKQHARAATMKKRLKFLLAQPEWDGKTGRKIIDEFVRGLVLDFAAEMEADGEDVAPGGVTMVTAMLVEEMMKNDDIDVGSFLKDWLAANISCVFSAAAGHPDRRIVLTDRMARV